ncbi:E3 ubiquitin-protein ligase RNF180 isoform 2-T2 [Rhinophrynus dorsalis]
MSNERTKDLLRCWKCRKCVADSDSLIKEQLPNQDKFDSSAYRCTCNIWHLDVESIPAWMKKTIEEVHWTIGKLNCPSCSARLGAFNFVGSSKCSCGLLATLHLCKSRIDYETAQLLKTPIPFSKTLVNPEDQPVFDTDGSAKNRSQRGLTLDHNMDEIGSVDETLCQDVQSSSKHFELSGRKHSFSAFSQNNSQFASKNMSARASRSDIHRKSDDLDFNIKELLKVQLILPENKSNRFYNRETEIPLAGSCSGNSEGSLPIQISTDHQSSAIDESTVRFAMSVENTSSITEPYYNIAIQVHHGSLPQISATEVSAAVHNTATDSSTMEEDLLQGHVGHVIYPSSSCLANVNQRLNKRQINKLKSMRRKQKKRDKWLQENKQTAKADLSTDEENEHVKENYTCVVCLDIYFNPYMCSPCHHIFCEPCLRTLARDNPAKTSCPLCRTTIIRVHYQSGFSRRTNPGARRLFSHVAYGLGFEDLNLGWRYYLDLVITWLFAIFIFCFICSLLLL